MKAKPAKNALPPSRWPERTGGDEEGEITGQCNGQPGIVDYYEQHWTTDDPNAPGTTSTSGETSKKSSFELKPLPTGYQYRRRKLLREHPWSWLLATSGPRVPFF